MTLVLHILLLLFIVITFLTSTIEKVTDWKGQLEWFEKHFNETILRPKIAFFLKALIILDFITSALAVIGLITLLWNGDQTYGVYAHISAAITVLCMLLGQRIAKDYQGASSLSTYFLVLIFGLYLLLIL